MVEWLALCLVWFVLDVVALGGLLCDFCGVIWELFELFWLLGLVGFGVLLDWLLVLFYIGEYCLMCGFV